MKTYWTKFKELVGAIFSMAFLILFAVGMAFILVYPVMWILSKI